MNLLATCCTMKTKTNTANDLHCLTKAWTLKPTYQNKQMCTYNVIVLFILECC